MKSAFGVKFRKFRLYPKKCHRRVIRSGHCGAVLSGTPYILSLWVEISKFKKLLILIIIASGLLPSKNHNCLYDLYTWVTFHSTLTCIIIMFRHEYPWSYTNSHVFSKCPTFRFFLANMIFFPVPKKLDSKFKLWFLIKLNSQIRVRPSARSFTEMIMVRVSTRLEKIFKSCYG